MSESLHRNSADSSHNYRIVTIREAPHRYILTLSLYPEGIAMAYKRIVVLLVGLTLAAISSKPAVAQEREAEVALQQAMHVEQVEGDLERAISLYKELVESFPTARDVAAQAQLHIGLCYEKLGLTEAREAYRSVIDGFPEQRDVVAVAQERLASLAQELAELQREPTFRKIEIASKPDNGVLSPDGSRLAFTSDGALWVVPLQGNVDPDMAGEPVRLTEPMCANNWGNELAWSGDGEWIAFNAEDNPPDCTGERTIHVIPSAGGQPRRIPGEHFMERQGYAANRLSLTPDGKTLAFSYIDPESEAADRDSHEGFQDDLSIYTIAVYGGEARQLARTWSSEPAFSPDGRFVAYVKFTSPEEERMWGSGPDSIRQREVWLIPATGGTPVVVDSSGGVRGPIWSPDGKWIAYNFERWGGGNESNEIRVIAVSDDGRPTGQAISIALPTESWQLLAGWTPENEIGVFLRDPPHGALFTVPASGGKAVQVAPEGPALHPGWSPDGRKIFVYRSVAEPFALSSVPVEGGQFTTVPIESDPVLVPVPPGTGVDVSPDGERIVFAGFLRTESGREDINIWTIPVEGGEPTQLTSSPTQDRYPCWSPDGRSVAFIRTSRGECGGGVCGGNIFVVPREGGAARQLTTDAHEVLWGKIAYSPDGQSIAYFARDTSISVIPADSGDPRIVVKKGVRFSHHSELSWSPDGTRIVYSGQAWPGPGGWRNPMPPRIWVVSIDGGDPVEVETGVLTGDMHDVHVAWSPDGETIAFWTWWGGDYEFWLIGDFLPEER
jgi:Tol biopolymer transport system component